MIRCAPSITAGPIQCLFGDAETTVATAYDMAALIRRTETDVRLRRAYIALDRLCLTSGYLPERFRAQALQGRRPKGVSATSSFTQADDALREIVELYLSQPSPRELEHTIGERDGIRPAAT